MDMALDVLGPRAGALHVEAGIAVAGPTVDLGVGDLGVELQADGGAIGEGLVRISAIGCGEQTGALRELAALAMPLVDVVGEGSEGLTLGRGKEWVIANLDQLVGMEPDLG